MTKVELIAAVANDANLTKKDAEAAVNSEIGRASCRERV